MIASYFWVPPAGWQEFEDIYNGLRALKAPPQFQHAVSLLLSAGQTFEQQSASGVTVNDDDVESWLTVAHNLAVKLKNAPMQSVATQGLNAPRGSGADASRYWYGPDYADASTQTFEADVFEVGKWVLVGLAGIFILPPLARLLNSMVPARRR